MTADINPKVSIIIATLNSADHIRECLDSVLDQTVEGIEVLVVDMGSNDGTQGIVREYADRDKRIRILSDNRGSAGHAKDMGVDKAVAPYVFFIEPYDTINRDTIEHMLLNFESAPECDVVIGLADFAVNEEERMNDLSSWNIDHAAYTKEAHDDMMFRLNVSEFEGLYSREFLKREGIMHYSEPGAGKQDIAFKFLTLAGTRLGVVGFGVYHRRREARQESIIDRRRVFDTCAELRYLEQMLKRVPEKWEKFRYAFWQDYFHENLNTYERLSGGLRPMLSARMHDDIKGSIRRGDFNSEHFDAMTRSSLELLLKSPKRFDEDWKRKDWDRQMDTAERQIESEKSVEAGRMARTARIEMETAIDFPENDRTEDKYMDKSWLRGEMGRDLASLRLLVGLTTDEMGAILGISPSMYKSIEAGKREVSWDQFMALLFMFHYNERTEGVVESLGLYPDNLKERLNKKGA
ncbi:MAG: glycosyltransferase [Lachnospiraceae bacterium]|nr:glycosyltransferase [Lachnospiraceae bacterium]